MTISPFDLHPVHASWKSCVKQGLEKMDKEYLERLKQSHQWLPGSHKIFNAFSLPLNQVNYILFGESPYPRAESANGYAFWDAAVTDLWSETGLNKKVNRATSLRHLVKMLLVAENLLTPKQTGQEDISLLNKSHLIQTNNELFTNFIKKGFLLLNATPVLADAPAKDAKAWRPFMETILACLQAERPQAMPILLGGIANKIKLMLPNSQVPLLIAEHPYNHTFVTNKKILDFFKPLHLLHPT